MSKIYRVFTTSNEGETIITNDLVKLTDEQAKTFTKDYSTDEINVGIICISKEEQNEN